MRLSKDRQTASAAIRVGKSFSMEARADISPVGLLAIGAMVGVILLGSAVIVATARRKQKPTPSTAIEADPAARI
ncbi:hypothetical protein GR702_18155 [Novosphingobium sp. FGD1]|jgi:hypothetical protein|uniref:Uncharacterized protein n=1 Tax=Novosphingobium silvae TaxID=2692619 RepID=A0A7X4GJB5_9SPHN|nr:hypothetical protein [Novosphingobium silvae]MYL99686.1 hypothetical protein [Novosphingobium silvae]